MHKTKMKSLPEFARTLRWSVTFCLAALLSACGPGTGGTGTGPINFSLIAESGSNTVPVQPGDLCLSGCGNYTLQLDEQRTEFVAGCRRFVYFGSWSVDANGALAITGSVETRTSVGTGSAPGTLQLQFSESQATSAQVTATLLNTGGTVLAGPAVLQRGDTLVAAAPAECGRP
jgi:hypothetical protein